MDKLSERNRKILWAIIQSYTNINTPVGSIKVTKSFSFGLSPATVRNIMASLEEMGYLQQPHTSAGRIPTTAGYRLYVNSLLKERRPSSGKALFDRLTSGLIISPDDSDRLIKEATKTLSSYSQYLSVAAQTEADRSSIKDLKLIKYDDNRALFILIANDDSVRSRFIDISSSLLQKDLDALSGYLNNLIKGLSFINAKNKLSSQLLDERSRNEYIEDLLSKCRDVISHESDIIINELAGTSNLPDFVSLPQIKDILKTIEDRRFFLKILKLVSSSKGVQVFVGMEKLIPSMRGLSMVASTYRDSRKVPGTIGIIGPISMNYKKLIPAVDHTAKKLTEIMSNA